MRQMSNMQWVVVIPSMVQVLCFYHISIELVPFHDIYNILVPNIYKLQEQYSE